ncbi:CehA/McbA family metallohydrolase [Dasania sp. GY-MA-18]|uniref:CehA/McbA family metallohydrolase n=1 Tax=Dasania sp. GY-MA-18 TaxID=2966584 RepID=UPI0021ACF978|nr:CehA/McbA family metallohydrolase [Dasania sp. GY-MA-18]MCR8924356.1 CehA/McbA family metallohydrolase [Dasania sp. GY-MA-18]
MYKKDIEVSADKPLTMTVNLARFANLPEQGWYSGDDHIHLSRSAPAANKNIMKMLAAEDVHVSNLLKMGNFSATHFQQYAFGTKGQYIDKNHAIASGVEDPRTAHRGHTISLNVTNPVHDRDKYYLYHKVFKEHQRQGGLTGYAHVDAGWFNEDRGLALDVPFGLVDFVEIMQNGAIHTGQWYDFLNLGYKLSPMAGSDFPYFIDQPGAVRAYAKVAGEFSPQAWFDAVKKGHVYVTNGPFLEFNINGESMGDSVKLTAGDELQVAANVSLNPDFDQLDRIELISQGEVITQIKAKEGEQTLKLETALKPSSGLWLAVRAFGKNQALAHSAPIYVNLGSDTHIAKDKAPAIANKLVGQLQLMKETPTPYGELEFWEIAPGFEPLWEKQKKELYLRIDGAIKQYNEIITIIDGR